MIEFKQGNLLKENTEALVNTVNCVGVMGKGIALQFKRAFPENFHIYKKACEIGEVQIGKMLVFSTGNLFYPRYIINFPTKRHWRNKSKISDIKLGLESLVLEVRRYQIQSIAIPPLGCGNGGLDWSQIKPIIVDTLAELTDVNISIFEPVGAPVPDQMLLGTSEPKMTRARALFIRLIELYGIPGYRLTKLEIQKLAYFLQVAGEPLQLKYKKHRFGPYAHNLNHVLRKIDGHFINGYGDGTQNSEMYVLKKGRDAANKFLENHPETNERLERVSQLISGFETPYGLEMLATLHWIAIETPEATVDCDRAIAQVRAWSDRKGRLFKVPHLRKAWEHLKAQNWLM
ncbi:macro domain-containing protein [Oxynema sp. CENA135]|uniref:type II toxin-antitoxin system antitoxin DNA ADP-ribosyl glycohydrolase DarG n=1 Tax=Oxynema sp. CENA135 TaxID=984206 RepID=UPI00190A887D|nr:macro domain-containing protein [Oxynema sp. CENA135]MBK4729312.1 macro domain-containing protein [Oxynema sp. CENA135]